MKKLFILLIGISLISAACTSDSGENQTPTPNPPSEQQTQVYENAFMRFDYPSGWNISVPSSNASAVNITKDNYILFINPQASQASGVTGGRFAEIAMGSPSADAVVTVQPSSPCGDSASTQVTEVYSRVDLFVSAQDSSETCNVPDNGKTVWYFSYITNQDNGYFNYYDQTQQQALVVTFSFNGQNPNDFPERDSEALNSMLAEMSGIVESLQIK